MRTILCLLVFVASGWWTGASGQEYPMTRKMSNPLFVDFPSPMYGSDSLGAMYTADPSAHVWTVDGREVLYVYASHDIEPPCGCDRMDRYHVFSTEDLVHWTDHGEILSANRVRREAGWGIEGFMWAPDCAYNPADKTYYFYFPHPDYAPDSSHIWRVGVATSRYPDRDFRLVGRVEGVPSQIDPCVFVDDDGQPYIYNGGGGQCFGGKLCRDDWTRLDGPMRPMEGLVDFHEATWIHKYNGRYYLTHSDNYHYLEGNRMRYAVSDSPLGPWTDMGIYMYPTGVETNHGSIVRFRGRWYAFYHTGNFSGHGALRSVCFDPIEYDDDGRLRIVRNFGSPRGGVLPEVASDDTPRHFEAEAYNDGGYHYGFFKHRGARPGNCDCRPEDPLMAITNDGRRCYLNDLSRGEWVRYSVRAQAGSRCDIVCTMAPAGEGEARFHLCVNGYDRTGEVTLVPGSGWQRVVLRDVALEAGEQYLDWRIDAGSLHFDGFEIRCAPSH